MRYYGDASPVSKPELCVESELDSLSFEGIYNRCLG